MSLLAGAGVGRPAPPGAVGVVSPSPYQPDNSPRRPQPLLQVAGARRPIQRSPSPAPPSLHSSLAARAP
ncbi:hypothetical protein Pmani_031037 [Petrolisthes manimaculis]|uniref:Uncharacterized protein n=1 Tax=Petrolisthes manimaculis TaxID=1843537 RepID=A0AAE1NW48_9EUCA|nr:hypothetical protein Pmani_031037 [Petrolisthes manimaculis]